MDLNDHDHVKAHPASVYRDPNDSRRPKLATFVDHPLTDARASDAPLVPAPISLRGGFLSGASEILRPLHLSPSIPSPPLFQCLTAREQWGKYRCLRQRWVLD